MGAVFIEEPSRDADVHHHEFWIEDLDGYVVGIASKPELSLSAWDQ